MRSDCSTKDFTEASEQINKNYFRKNRLSGKYEQYDEITGELRETGYFQNGREVGKWCEIDEDGDQKVFQYQSYRVGAICRDGTRSSATGSGACSWHGGVDHWLQQNKKKFIYGTGKYEPLSTQILKIKPKITEITGCNLMGEQFQLVAYQYLIRQNDQILADQKEIKQLRLQLKKNQDKKSKLEIFRFEVPLQQKQFYSPVKIGSYQLQQRSTESPKQLNKQQKDEKESIKQEKDEKQLVLLQNNPKKIAEVAESVSLKEAPLNNASPLQEIFQQCKQEQSRYTKAASILVDETELQADCTSTLQSEELLETTMPLNAFWKVKRDQLD